MLHLLLLLCLDFAKCTTSSLTSLQQILVDWELCSQYEAYHLCRGIVYTVNQPLYGKPYAGVCANATFVCKFEYIFSMAILSYKPLPTVWGGKLPTTGFNLFVDLQTLQLGGHSTQLSGTIPTEIWNMPKLQTLALGSNALEGTLPATSPLYKSVSKIYLNNNQLFGEIPVALTSALPLHLDLSNNNFQGVVPAFGQTIASQEFCSLANNPELVCPVSGPGACAVSCPTGCVFNDTRFQTCVSPICLAQGVAACYDPCVGCLKCVLNSTFYYTCLSYPTPSPTPTPTPTPSPTPQSMGISKSTQATSYGSTSTVVPTSQTQRPPTYSFINHDTTSNDGTEMAGAFLFGFLFFLMFVVEEFALLKSQRVV